MPRLLMLIAVVLSGAVSLLLLWQRLMRRDAGPDAAASPSPVAGLLLFLVPLPVAAAAVVALARGQLWPLLGDLLGYGLFLGGALLVRRGVRFPGGAAGVRRPFKLLGSVLIGLATGVTAWLGVGHHPAIAVAFALVALLGCYLTYGFDWYPGRSNGRGLSKQAGAALAQAQQTLIAIEQAGRDIRQPDLGARLRRIIGLARAILSRLEDDPRDLRRARKFLNVYLDGVQHVVAGYAKTHQHISTPELDERFLRALITVEAVFREQQQALLASDLDQLDVQLEVLTQQLQREGII
ncbi:5-bromo-4-chloroindolyl phosphate hydrolysis family protein [uncultured Lamprocystis sp.]|jgi:hypothetical protein|uniref:5-bromo-4-chloroindolyl phosphate hydrolysis family protein n=1 Tax=uncultured Lamprocystis sp. TaxID=543132 RepID=UPI0025F104EC|nr:5-bromo-4-chloroindolyl phosphate hydrolysis family protein [uncultured Lamprocystis sp.]